MSKQDKHTHKFKRLKYKSGNCIFFCALPDCSQKISTALALGKRSICWRCGETFIMSEYSLRLAKPHCDACHKPKKVEVDNLIEVVRYGLHPLEDISLADRLQQTIQQAQKTTIEEEEI